MGPSLVLIGTILAAAPKVPVPAPTPVPVVAEGSTLVRTLRAPTIDRYVLDVADKGTVLIFITPIDGLTPKAVLKNDENLIIRRADRHGQIWSRPPAGTKLFLEITQPKDADGASTYLLKIAFDVDRPRPQRHLPRPSRPGEIVRVPVGAVYELDRVSIDGIVADYKVAAPDVLVTVPAFARTGDVELLFQSGETKRQHIDLIGTEPPSNDVVTKACTRGTPGCIQLVIDPRVGSKWLHAIAKLVDADITRHAQKTGIVELRLRMPQNEAFALETLSSIKGVVSARH
jgi:hypothetical protein